MNGLILLIVLFLFWSAIVMLPVIIGWICMKIDDWWYQDFREWENDEDAKQPSWWRRWFHDKG